MSLIEQYPIPTMEDMIACLTEGEKYTKLDMSHAYQQIELEDDSRKYVTVNTQGTFHIHKTILWCELQPSYISAHDEGCAARD